LDEEFETILTGPGVTQLFLLIRPTDKAVARVILFAGNDGELGLSYQEIRQGTDNFLVRNRKTACHY